MIWEAMSVGRVEPENASILALSESIRQVSRSFHPDIKSQVSKLMLP